MHRLLVEAVWNEQSDQVGAQLKAIRDYYVSMSITQVVVIASFFQRNVLIDLCVDLATVLKF